MANLHEECGVFGVYSPKTGPVADLAYYGLYALQHRGQESCGIVVNDDGVFASRKDIGLVNEVFSRDDLMKFPQGRMAVAHARYGTTGGNSRANCQPIEVNHQKGKMALAHNGNLSNAYELRSELELGGAIFHTTSDTEIIAYIVTQARLNSPSIENALSSAMNRLEGAYSLVLMSAAKLLAARDPYGFRPLCYGKTLDGTYVVASESCALSAVGAKFERDILPGEILVFDENGVRSNRDHCGEKPRRSCIFEYIYFARPDSVIDGVSVHAARKNAGAILSKTHPVEADVVMGVPDSGIDAALGYAEASGIPYGMGFIKNKYIILRIHHCLILPSTTHKPFSLLPDWYLYIQLLNLIYRILPPVLSCQIAFENIYCSFFHLKIILYLISARFSVIPYQSPAFFLLQYPLNHSSNDCLLIHHWLPNNTKPPPS